MAEHDPMRIAPSILSADFTELGAEVVRVERAGAHQLHVDVMDGHYVPNLTFGPMVVQALRRVTDLPLDVHLMIEDTDRWVETYAGAGADMIAFHPESIQHPHLTVTKIRDCGKSPGLALNPSTSFVAVEELLPIVDYAIVMSVNPGWGGQKFIEGSFERVARLRSLAEENGWDLSIEIDGGMEPGRLPAAAAAGVDVVIAGSAIFGAEDPAAVVREMLRLASATPASTPRGAGGG